MIVTFASIIDMLDSGFACVQKIASPRKLDEEETLTDVSIEHFTIMKGTPVICHGLKNASHLNGKLGEIVSFHDCNISYQSTIITMTIMHGGQSTQSTLRSQEHVTLTQQLRLANKPNHASI